MTYMINEDNFNRIINQIQDGSATDEQLQTIVEAVEFFKKLKQIFVKGVSVQWYSDCERVTHQGTIIDIVENCAVIKLNRAISSEGSYKETRKTYMPLYALKVI